MSKKIIFIDSYHDAVYGAQRSMVALSTLLNNDGFDIVIATLANGKLVEYAQKKNIKTKTIKISNIEIPSVKSIDTFWGKAKYIYTILFCGLCSLKFIRYFRSFDVICLNDIRSILFLFPVLIFTRKKNFWYVRIREENKILNRLFSLLVRKIIFISSDAKSTFKIINDDKKCVVHTGFPKKTLSLKKCNNNKIRFISVGSINDRKNQLDLLDVFKFIKDNSSIDISLDIYGGYEDGDYQYYNKLKNKISNDEFLSNSVKLMGYSDEIENVLSQYDVFIFSSKREGLPRSIIEALQSGLYVITSDVDGVKDIIINDKLGCIYKNKEDIDIINAFKSNEIFSENSRMYRNNYINEFFSEDAFLANFKKQIDISNI